MGGDGGNSALARCVPCTLPPHRTVAAGAKFFPISRNNTKNCFPRRMWTFTSCARNGGNSWAAPASRGLRSEVVELWSWGNATAIVCSTGRGAVEILSISPTPCLCRWSHVRHLQFSNECRSRREPMNGDIRTIGISKRPNVIFRMKRQVSFVNFYEVG